MDTFLAYWAEDGDDSLDTFETEQEAVDCLEEWIERRRDDAADEGWPLGMRGYVARLTHRVQEYETRAPEGSSFESCCDYAVKSLPDAQAARIAALEGEVHRLSEALNSIKLDRESSDVTWCPQCGPHVSVDDEGLCEMCGATSVGAGAARAVALAEENAALRAKFEGAEMVFAEHAEAVGVLAASHVGALDFVESIEALIEEVSQLRPLAAPLRLGRGPTDDTEESIGVRMIAAERQRQIVKEGRTSAHDDEHAAGEMASAAACYAGQVFTPTREPPPNWPWERRWWKPKGGRIRVLAKAGALIAAEIDRLSRAASRQPCGVGVTQGQAMAEAFKDLAQRQTALGAEASAALTPQDLWDMYITGDKETP